MAALIGNEGEVALKALKGETLPKTIDTGFYWYDKTNIDSKEIAPLLYKQ